MFWFIFGRGWLVDLTWGNAYINIWEEFWNTCSCLWQSLIARCGQQDIEIQLLTSFCLIIIYFPGLEWPRPRLGLSLLPSFPANPWQVLVVVCWEISAWSCWLCSPVTPVKVWEKKEEEKKGRQKDRDLRSARSVLCKTVKSFLKTKFSCANRL